MHIQYFFQTETDILFFKDGEMDLFKKNRDTFLDRQRQMDRHTFFRQTERLKERNFFLDRDTFSDGHFFQMDRQILIQTDFFQMDR